MRKIVLAGAVAALLTAGLGAQALAAGKPSPIAAAVADSSRAKADTDRDANRKPVEVLTFAGVKRGDKVADYMAGGGYFTHIFSGVVGPKGHVYAQEPAEIEKFDAKDIAALKEWAKTHPNVTVGTGSAMAQTAFPEKLDLFWISQNYHDLKDSFMGPVDTAAFNKAVFKALKPGGTYIVLDHVAQAGDATAPDKLHRIDPALVRKEVEAAGFKFEGESKLLANPNDPHTALVFDKSIRGHTDQFIYKFRKPRR
ncbi:MAG: class I SAM-dependent methyltransferase [Proteobacteria bacterium]|nr:class I SAM-dependent methyltransferase [Pseudomonadota bacterium]